MQFTLAHSSFAALAVSLCLAAGNFASAEEAPTKDAKAPKDPAVSKEKTAKALEASDAFFKEEKVVTLDIQLSAPPGSIKPRIQSLLQLKNAPRTYVKATITEGGESYPDVGVHLRGGLGSFQPIEGKAGFTVNMDKFDQQKNFHGMEKWHLCNGAQDGSYLSELVANDMLRSAGVPAPRIRHAILTVNGESKGFYYIKEGYDKYFLRRYFKNSDGNFYDGGFLKDVDQPIELTRTKEDVKDWADLKALVAAAREPDLTKRFAALEKVLDMDVFISGFCVQAILGDWDGYVFNRNNYRIYHEPKLDKIIFLPSGLDQEFGNAEAGPLVPPMKGLVAIAVFETPEGKARYFKRMAEINSTIMDPVKWNKRLDELEARLQPEVAKCDAAAGKAYATQVKRIRDFFNVRGKSIERQLKEVK